MEKGLFYTVTDELTQDDSELTSLFIQLQQKIRNRRSLYITPIKFHTGLPGTLAQGNNDTDKLLIEIALEDLKFHKIHHINSKVLMKEFSMKSETMSYFLII